MKSFRTRIAAMLSLSMFVALLPLTAAPVLASATDLFFSEYIEGSSFNKAIEIYNGTGSSVDLSTVTVERYSNGSATVTSTAVLSGSLADGDVYVMAHASADAVILAAADLTHAVVNWNGDDAVVLKVSGVVVDSIGQVGFDPGSSWGSGSTMTQNDTLLKAPAECAGDTDPSDAYEPADRWVGLPEDTFDDLGAHTADCGAPAAVVLINEVDADQTGTDSAEFVELFDGGVGNTALDGLSVVLYNGSDELSYLAFDLDGMTTDVDGYFVLCGDAANVANCDLDVSPDTNLIQNGVDAVALIVGDAVDYPNDTALPADGDIVDAIVYDTDDSDSPGLLVLLNDSQPQVNERGGGEGVIHSNQRCDNGSGGLRNTDTYTQSTPTPGETNNCPAPAPVVLINEVDADQAGTDSAEFVELFDGGVGNSALDGLSVVLYNGSDDLSYLAFDLDGMSTDVDGYFVLCGDAANVANCDLDVSPDTNLIQNGVDAVALIVGDAADYPNDTALPADGDIVDAIVYDTDDGDDAALLVLLNGGQPQVNERDGGDGTIHSNQRCDNGSGGLRNTDTYTQATPTPGETNSCAAPPAPAVPVFIHEIQGSGATSPLVGDNVEIQGVVVGDFQTGGLNGFHVQEEDADADADATTSEGIFVRYPANVVDVALGDVVTVTGQVSEFFDLTQVNADTVVVDSSGASVTPAELVLPFAGFDLETVEGMSIHIAQPVVISEYFNYDRFGEIVLTVDRAFTPTATYAPGSPEAAAAALLNADGRITLDDGQTSQNPDFSRHPNGLEFTSSNYFRGGDTLTDVVGVMDYSFGNYKIQPTGPATYDAVNPRTGAPAVGGTLSVATFNVLNYFSTIDTGASICGPAADQGCRGADNASEFDRQRTKIIAAIAEIDADVVGLMEIENHATDAALIDLVDGLNAVMGAGTYARVDSGTPGDDVIKVALIYKPATVTAVGISAVLDTADFVDPMGYGSDKNRAAIAQAFSDDASGVEFVVSVNHLKSKGSSCAVGDDDPEAGSCNLTRTLAAGVLAAWLDDDPTGTLSDNVLIIGDLNSYDHESPIDTLVAAGYSDVVRDEIGESAYSYVFSGQWGYLDYVMANESIGEFITGAAIWHVNSDEADLIDYDNSFKSAAQIAAWTSGPYRSSDHDPVIIGLQLEVTLPATGADVAAPSTVGLAFLLFGSLLAVLARKEDEQGATA